MGNLYCNGTGLLQTLDQLPINERPSPPYSENHMEMD